MSRITLDQEVFGLSSLFERLTHAKVVDCFKEQDTVYFIIAQGNIGKAIGKGGSNIHRVMREIGKKVKLIEYNEDVVSFVKNVIYPVRVEQIVLGPGVVEIRDSSKKTKGALIGRGGSNLEIIQRAVQRFFPLEVKVV